MHIRQPSPVTNGGWLSGRVFSPVQAASHLLVLMMLLTVPKVASNMPAINYRAFSYSRKNKRAVLFISLLMIYVTGCAGVVTKGPTTLTDPPAHVTQVDREHAALAFISYVGEELDFPDEAVDSILYWCVKNELNTQPLTKGKYELIWGPAVFKFKDSRLDDNMMFIARRAGTKKVAVAIRGTNFASVSDWLAEDLNVTHPVPWNIPKSKMDAPTNPRISRATETGLNVLKTLTPEFPGLTPKTVRQFLQEGASNGNIDEVTILGHSLAGALAPAFALWLSDTRPRWDPTASVNISVTALAGATAGNRDYSRYYDSQLGKSTNRIHNPYDIVPLAWDESTLMTLPGLYALSDIKADGFDRFLVQEAMDLVENTDYTQILPNSPSLKGGVLQSPATMKFLQQAAWQHHCGYYCGLGIAQGSKTPLNPLQPCAGKTKPVTCDVCPKEAP